MVKTISYTLISIIAFVLLVPTVMLAVNSFRTNQELSADPPIIIPRELTLKNYRVLFSYPVGRWTANSLCIAATATTVTAIVVMMAGYAFAKKPIPGKETLFWIMIVSMMVPGTVTFVPSFVLMVKLKLVNTLAGVILPGCVSVGYLFYLRQYLLDLPKDFIDQAEIDGCSELGIFFRVILPISSAAVWTIALLTFLGHWNSFLWPLMMLYDRAKYTLPLGIEQIIYDDNMNRNPGELLPNFGLMMAGGAYLMFPGILLFTIFHRWFVSGLWGGLK